MKGRAEGCTSPTTGEVSRKEYRVQIWDAVHDSLQIRWDLGRVTQERTSVASSGLEFNLTTIYTDILKPTVEFSLIMLRSCLSPNTRHCCHAKLACSLRILCGGLWIISWKAHSASGVARTPPLHFLWRHPQEKKLYLCWIAAALKKRFGPFPITDSVSILETGRRPSEILPPAPHPVRYTSVSRSPVTPIVPTLIARAGSLMQATVVKQLQKRLQWEEDPQACWHKHNQQNRTVLF